MTRGTFTIFTDSISWLRENEIALLTSPEFNGDMGPNMKKGKVFGKAFIDQVQDIKSFDDLILQTSEVFGKEVPDDNYLIHFTDVFSADDFTNPEKHWKVYEEHRYSEWSEEAQDYVTRQHYEDNPWVKYFHYSDFAYVKNLTKRPILLEDGDGMKFQLHPNDWCIFHFGKFWDVEEHKEDENG